VSNWEAAHLLAKTGAMPVGKGGFPAFPFLDQGSSRIRPGQAYPDKAEATSDRGAAADERDRNAQVLSTLLQFQYGASDGAADALVSPQATLFFADFGTEAGPAGLNSRRDAFAAAFSEVRIDLKMMAVESGRAAARWELSCVHSGPYFGLPATGRPVTVSGSSYGRIEGGRVTEWIDVLDALRLLRTIGAMASVLPGCHPDQ
jgi:predicted ester cyclase